MHSQQWFKCPSKIAYTPTRSMADHHAGSGRAHAEFEVIRFRAQCAYGDGDFLPGRSVLKSVENIFRAQHSGIDP
jgi:hypothetical protein